MLRLARAIFSALLAANLLLTACESAWPYYKCTDPLGCLEIPEGSPVIIGIMYAAAGEYASPGSDSLRGVELAVEDKGNILGHPIKLILYGTDCTVENARLAATSLATQPDLLAVIGPTCENERQSAANILSDAGIVLLTSDGSAEAAYLSAMLIFSAIEQTAIQRKDGLYLPRLALRQALQGSP